MSTPADEQTVPTGDAVPTGHAVPSDGPPGRRPVRVLVIDSYDSFTYKSVSSFGHSTREADALFFQFGLTYPSVYPGQSYLYNQE